MIKILYIDSSTNKKALAQYVNAKRSLLEDWNNAAKNEDKTFVVNVGSKTKQIAICLKALYLEKDCDSSIQLSLTMGKDNSTNKFWLIGITDSNLNEIKEFGLPEICLLTGNDKSIPKNLFKHIIDNSPTVTAGILPGTEHIHSHYGNLSTQSILNNEKLILKNKLCLIVRIDCVKHFFNNL